MWCINTQGVVGLWRKISKLDSLLRHQGFEHDSSLTENRRFATCYVAVNCSKKSVDHNTRLCRKMYNPISACESCAKQNQLPRQELAPNNKNLHNDGQVTNARINSGLGECIVKSECPFWCTIEWAVPKCHRKVRDIAHAVIVDEVGPEMTLESCTVDSFWCIYSSYGPSHSQGIRLGTFVMSSGLETR